MKTTEDDQAQQEIVVVPSQQQTGDSTTTPLRHIRKSEAHLSKFSVQTAAAGPSVRYTPELRGDAELVFQNNSDLLHEQAVTSNCDGEDVK